MRPRASVSAAVLASLAPCLLATSASGAKLTMRDVGRVGAEVRSDGERYVATATGGGAVTVLDTARNRVSKRRTPRGCWFRGLGAGTLLWACRDGTGRTFNLRNGARGSLPVPRPRSSHPKVSPSYEDIGTRWARARFVGYLSSYEVFVERRTGRQVIPPTPTRRVIPDLDRPEVMRRLCASVRRPLVPGGDIGVQPGPLTLLGGWAARTTFSHTRLPIARVQLQHCERPTRTVRTCRGVFCTQPVLSRRVIAWVEERPGSAGRVTIRLRYLGSRRERSVRTDGPVQLLMAGQRLFVAAGGRLWAART